VFGWVGAGGEREVSGGRRRGLERVVCARSSRQGGRATSIKGARGQGSPARAGFARGERERRRRPEPKKGTGGESDERRRRRLSSLSFPPLSPLPFSRPAAPPPPVRSPPPGGAAYWAARGARADRRRAGWGWAGRRGSARAGRRGAERGERERAREAKRLSLQTLERSRPLAALARETPQAARARGGFAGGGHPRARGAEGGGPARAGAREPPAPLAFSRRKPQAETKKKLFSFAPPAPLRAPPPPRSLRARSQ
jgi:hypothetical protein